VIMITKFDPTVDHEDQDEADPQSPAITGRDEAEAIGQKRPSSTASPRITICLRGNSVKYKNRKANSRGYSHLAGFCQSQ